MGLDFLVSGSTISSLHLSAWCQGAGTKTSKNVVFWGNSVTLKSEINNIYQLLTKKKNVIACDSEIILPALLKSKLILTKLKSFDCRKKTWYFSRSECKNIFEGNPFRPDRLRQSGACCSIREVLFQPW